MIGSKKPLASSSYFQGKKRKEKETNQICIYYLENLISKFHKYGKNYNEKESQIHI